MATKIFSYNSYFLSFCSLVLVPLMCAAGAMTKRVLTNYILSLDSAFRLHGLLFLKAQSVVHAHMQINAPNAQKKENEIKKCSNAHLVPQCFVVIYLDDSQPCEDG